MYADHTSNSAIRIRLLDVWGRNLMLNVLQPIKSSDTIYITQYKNNTKNGTYVQVVKHAINELYYHRDNNTILYMSRYHICEYASTNEFIKHGIDWRPVIGTEHYIYDKISPKVDVGERKTIRTFNINLQIDWLNTGHPISN